MHYQLHAAQTALSQESLRHHALPDLQPGCLPGRFTQSQRAYFSLHLSRRACFLLRRSVADFHFDALYPRRGIAHTVQLSELPVDD